MSRLSERSSWGRVVLLEMLVRSLRKKVWQTLAAGILNWDMTLQTTDVSVIGAELAIRWSDGGESFIALEKLRRACPCAGCNGERDIMGNLYKSPEKPLVEQSFRLARVSFVGGYALQPIWGDGHSTGIYSFEYLRRLAEVT